MLFAAVVSASIAGQSIPVSPEFNAATDHWLTCLFANLGELIDAPETAEAVARAAMANCSTEFRNLESQLRRDIAPYYDEQGARAEAELRLNNIRENTREQLMGTVMTARVRRGGNPR